MTLRFGNKVLLTVMLLLTSALGALITVPTAQGAFIAGTSNNTNTAASNPYFTCATAEVGESSTKAYFAYALGDSSGTTAADASGNGRAGTYTSGGITYGVASTVCPRDKTTVVTLDGSSGYLIATQSSAATTAPQTFSEEIWFKTSTIAGKLIGFGSSNKLDGTASGNYDRHLYMNSSGLITFGVYNNGTVTLTTPTPSTSTNNYADGKWHYAVGTMGSGGMRLYLDGTLAASNGNTAGESTSGWWHVGYDNLSGSWPNQPTSSYFKGQLARAAVYSVVLSANQVASHYAAGAS